MTSSTQAPTADRHPFGSESSKSSSAVAPDGRCSQASRFAIMSVLFVMEAFIERRRASNMPRGQLGWSHSWLPQAPIHTKCSALTVFDAVLEDAALAMPQEALMPREMGQAANAGQARVRYRHDQHLTRTIRLFTPLDGDMASPNGVLASARVPSSVRNVSMREVACWLDEVMRATRSLAARLSCGCRKPKATARWEDAPSRRR